MKASDWTARPKRLTGTFQICASCFFLGTQRTALSHSHCRVSKVSWVTSIVHSDTGTTGSRQVTSRVSRITGRYNTVSQHVMLCSNQARCYEWTHVVKLWTNFLMILSNIGVVALVTSPSRTSPVRTVWMWKKVSDTVWKSTINT